MIKHTAEEFGAGGQGEHAHHYQGRCPCGWIGPWRPDLGTASADCDAHNRGLAITPEDPPGPQ